MNDRQVPEETVDSSSVDERRALTAVASPRADPTAETISPPPRSCTQAPRLAPRHRDLLRVADLAASTISAVLGAAVVTDFAPAQVGDLSLREILIAALALALAIQVHGLYRRPASRLRPSGWWRPLVVAPCLPTATLLPLGVEAVLFPDSPLTLTGAVAMTVPAVVLVPLCRSLAVRTFGSPTVTRILVVGTGKVTNRLISRFDRCRDTNVIGQVDDNPAPGSRVLGRLADLGDLCHRHTIDRVVVGFSHTPDREILEGLRQLDGQVPVSVVPRMFELHSWRSDIEELHGMPLVHVPPAELGLNARVGKRILDLAVSISAVALSWPLWLAIALAVRLDTPGPVFFRQERAGRGGHAFRIFKFRTMTADAWQRRGTVEKQNEVDGPLFKMQSDPRVTRVGRFLRRTSLDELPQLLNVICGDMSLVGPRPLPVEESDQLDGAALTRLDVAPGITGLWQISGRSDLSYADLQHLDSVYVRSWSLLWDLRIIAETPRSLLGGRGAY